MKRFILCVTLVMLLLPVTNALGARLHLEKVYQNQWCSQKSGKSQRIPDKIGTGYTVADCVFGNYAVEVDFANKWKECAGQGLYYADRLDVIPGCLLIMESPEKDKKYLNRLKSFEQRGLKIWTITPKDLTYD